MFFKLCFWRRVSTNLGKVISPDHGRQCRRRDFESFEGEELRDASHPRQRESRGTFFLNNLATAKTVANLESGHGADAKADSAIAVGQKLVQDI